MRRFMLMSATLTVLSLGTAAGSAAPMHGMAAAAPAPALTLVQGWWEQENRNDAPDRYWQLKRTDRRRYDNYQSRIEQRHRRYHLDQYDRRDNRDLRQQHLILRYQWQQ